MSTDPAGRLQTRAYLRIKDGIGNEFSKHITEWQIHTTSLFGHAHQALDKFEFHLKDMKAAQDADRQRTQALGMFVLSLVGGAALSFVHGAIEERLAPRLFGSRAKTVRTVPNPKYERLSRQIAKPIQKDESSSQIVGIPLPSVKTTQQRNETHKAVQTISPPVPAPKTVKRTVFDPDWSKTKGQMLADLGTNFISDFDVLLPAIAPARTQLDNAINMVPSSLD
jgi:hypothetical protein